MQDGSWELVESLGECLALKALYFHQVQVVEEVQWHETCLAVIHKPVNISIK